MKNRYDIIRLALILSKQAEIEGMRVENLIREQSNLVPAYGCDEFLNLSEDLGNLAHANNEQLLLL